MRLFAIVVPIGMLVAGTIGGLMAGSTQAPEDPPADPGMAESTDTAALEKPEDSATSYYVEISNRFTVPVLDDQGVRALVVITLSAEVDEEYSAAVRDKMPKLRDAFLQVMLDHGAVGGFDGAFLANASLDRLRDNLDAAGRDLIGDGFRRILITDIARQDL